MQKQPGLQATILSNLIWFAVSLGLAFTVWMVAISQRDPIEERRLTERAAIQFEYDAATMLLTDTSSETVSVRARGQRSAVSLMTAEDVTVNADLTALAPGTHQVPLHVEVGRERVSVDTVPRQVSVTLELLESRLVPVRANLSGDVPPGYVLGETALDALQTTVIGAASRVAQVAEAIITVDLADQRTDVVTSARLTPVDAEGRPVDGVTLTPANATVTVPVRQRPDVREVSVQPNIVGSDAMPEGYLLTSLSYEPDSVLVSGAASLLENLPETLFTAPIDLRDRTSDFEVAVPIELPSRELVVISGQTITVQIGITAQTASRQFDGVDVEVIGLGEGLEASIAPLQVTLLITGPQPALEGLRAADVRVILDLNGLAAGSYQLPPQPALAQGQLADVTISVLPASIDVTITDPRATPEATTGAGG